MADSPETPEPFSLKRWSRRKTAAARAIPAPIPAPATSVPAATDVADAAAAHPVDAAPLPPVESLTYESDFSAFMQPKVAEDTKRAALRKLFSDPSFNVMDGLDIYVGDYTQADPMPAGMLEKLSAVYSMLDPVDPERREPPPGPLPAPAGDVVPAADSAPSVTLDMDSPPAPAGTAPDADTSKAQVNPASGARNA
jgi:hypothetical protein